MTSGKQHNHCWSSFSEASWKLFMDSYVNQPLPEILQTTGKDLKLDDILGDENVSNIFGEIQDSMKKCENDEFGKTAQQYVQYIKIAEQQHLLHYATKTNDYEM